MARLEPLEKRAIAFFDGQNLFNAAKNNFGNQYPDYDPVALAEMVCQANGWKLVQVRHYTGLHDPREKPFWHKYWVAKMAAMRRAGVHTYFRPLRYRTQELRWPDGRPITLPDGSDYTIRVGQEKGVDIRIALDVVGLAVEKAYDVAIIFSQDQDLSEAVDEVKRLSQVQDRWIKVASAYPHSATPVKPRASNGRGINGSDWFPINQVSYTTCLDPNDYRPPKPGP